MRNDRKRMPHFSGLLCKAMILVLIFALCAPGVQYAEAEDPFVWLFHEKNEQQPILYRTSEEPSDFLPGKWLISGKESGEDGYMEIEIHDDMKTMTVSTLNIIRYYQLYSDEVIYYVICGYDTVAESLAAADKANQNLLAYEDTMNEVFAYIMSFTPDMAADAGLSFEYFESEIEQVNVDAPENASLVLNEKRIAEIQTDAQKCYEKLQKNLSNGEESFMDVLEMLSAYQTIAYKAEKGAKITYEADASYSWVTEDSYAFECAFLDENPQLFSNIEYENLAACEAYERALLAYEEALYDTNEAKCKYDEAYDYAQYRISDQKAALDEAYEAANNALDTLKRQRDAEHKNYQALLDEKLTAYAKAIEEANREIETVYEEYRARVAAGESVNIASYEREITVLKAMKAAEIEMARYEAEAAIAETEQAVAALNEEYERKLEAQKAENEAIISAAAAAYDTASKDVESIYKDEFDAYKELKQVSDALKKQIPQKVSLYTYQEIAEIAIEMADPDELLAQKVYDRLDEEKAKAYEGYLICEQAQMELEDCIKSAEKGAKAAQSARKNFDKELSKLISYAQMLNPEYDIEDPQVSVDPIEIPSLRVPSYENDSEEPLMMITKGKVKVNNKKGYAVLTFANGKEIEFNYFYMLEENIDEYIYD